MNKFIVVSCINVGDEDSTKDIDYEGTVVVLSCTSDPTSLLFFPVPEDNANTINYVLKGNVDFDVNANVLGIYRTMVESWRGGDRFLSGIIMDAVYDEKSRDHVIMIRLVLSHDTGELDSLVPVNFLHAILLAAMERVEIIVSDKLLSKLVPANEDLIEEAASTIPHPSFPEDKNLMRIVQDIMSAGEKNGNAISSSDDKKEEKKIRGRSRKKDKDKDKDSGAIVE